MEQIIINISSGITARSLYPAGHPRVAEANARLVASVNDLGAGRRGDSVTFLIVGDDLILGDEVLRKPTLAQRQFTQVLKRRGIERLTLAAGLEPEEADRFLFALASGQNPVASPHVILGRVLALEEDQGRDKQGEELLMDDFHSVQEAFARFRIDHRLLLRPMERLVWSFIDSMSTRPGAMLPLARLKEHDEYTFIHAVNVSMLVLALARSFGIQGTTLHAFGMAALLHDVGKLMVPLDVLNKPGKLDGDQWTVMQSHAEQGAWYLGELEEASPLSILVAYEHHLRYDTQPGYPILPTPRLPNLASRMTSIADAYDAMATIRPYQKPILKTAAVEILRKRAETFYDPLLVANFIQLVEERDIG